MLLAGTAACSSGEDGGTPGEPAPRSSTGSPPASSPGTPGTVWGGAPETIAALGDSITTGFDTCALLADCPEASWSTGSEDGIDSLAQRLLPEPDGRTWNHAVAGAMMADLPGQVEKAVANGPDLVTVLIGANDACAPTVARMTPVAEFREDFTSALESLRAGSPDSRVYVASVPDLLRLWSEGRKNEQAAQVWEFGVCQSMLSEPDAVDAAAEERRAQVDARVQEYNTALGEVCAEDELCRYDGGDVHEYRFTGDELSEYDWFHPSRSGQRILARLAHENLTGD